MSKRLPLLLVLALALGVAPAGAEPAAGSSLGLGTTTGPPPARPASLAPQVAITGQPTLGREDAPVTLVEFLDYECSYCQAYARDTWPRIKANYVDTGKLRYVARDFPLGKHNRARPAAIAAACAGEQGRFWEMHDALLGAAGQLRDEDITRHAEGMGLDMKTFDGCRAEVRHQARLDADVAAARAAGASGTPSFLVGASAGADVARGRLLQGDEDYAAFEKLLARYLGTAAP